MSNGGYYRKCPKMTLTLAKQTQLGLVESMGLGPISLVIISFQFSNKKSLGASPTFCVLCALSLSLSLCVWSKLLGGFQFIIGNHYVMD